MVLPIYVLTWTSGVVLGWALGNRSLLAVLAAALVGAALGHYATLFTARVMNQHLDD